MKLPSTYRNIGNIKMLLAFIGLIISSTNTGSTVSLNPMIYDSDATIYTEVDTEYIILKEKAIEYSEINSKVMKEFTVLFSNR